ncbi:MAG: RloB family protein [Verrucomicrobiota bacterium]
MKAKHFNRGARSYFRGVPQHATASGKTILIVSEGKETEPQYFNALKNRLKLGAAIIVTVAKGTDAKSVVESAKRLRKERACEVRQGRSVPFDEVWCVFDSESHQNRPHLAEALVMARDNKIKVALSWPCIEFWFLLHETYTSAAFSDYASVEKVLKKYYPEYQKNDVPTAALLEKLVTAVVNARQLRADNAKSGSKEPATNADLLACSMNEATRLGLKYSMPPEK